MVFLSFIKKRDDDDDDDGDDTDKLYVIEPCQRFTARRQKSVQNLTAEQGVTGS